MSFIAVKQSSGCTSRKRRSPRRERGDVADPVAERVGLRRDAAALGEGRVESLALGDREHRAAADELARERVGLPRPVADRNVDRDALHVGERGEVRLDALEQSRLAKAAVDQDDRDPAALGAVDAGYELCHAASLPTNGRRRRSPSVGCDRSAL